MFHFLVCSTVSVFNSAPQILCRFHSGSSSFQCIIIIAAFILFCLCKITIVNVISSYMLVKTPSGELLVAYMPYVIQKYVYIYRH